MPAATTFNLVDSESANLGMTPETSQNGVTTFRETAVDVATEAVRSTVRNVNTKQGVTNSFKVSLPVAGTLPSGAPGILRTLRATVTYELPDGCTAQEREDLDAYVKSGLAVAQIQGAMRDYLYLY